MLQKSEVSRNRKRLKQIQQMFIFMKEMVAEARPHGSIHDPSAVVTHSAPIILTGSGLDPSGARMIYTATISMQPTNSIPDAPELHGFQGSDRLRSNKQDLNALRQSPYFSIDLLQQPRDGGSSEDLPEDGQKSLYKRTRFQDREEAKLKSSLTSDSARDHLELPSDLDASRDVDRLLETVSNASKFNRKIQSG